MKRHFLAGFMAFCVCAMSLSTVSCTKDIETELDNLKEEVAGLAQKLADLEAKLTSEVNAINAAIAAVDAKVAVVGVEEVNGVVVLTLANGDEITVANGNNAKLVTIVTVDGVDYWALVKNDGTTENLDVVVGHPDVKLSFKVDPETNELLISYNGTDYESTGVIVKDPDAYDHIVNGFEDDEEYVTITIGENSYQLPKYEALGQVELSRTNIFVNYGATKTIVLDTENAKDVYVMNQPTGWEAVLENDKLTITAPAKAVIEMGAAATKGQVLVHATNVAGNCTVAKVEVRTGPATSLSIDAEGNVTLFNALTSTSTNPWGETTTDFTPIVVGISTAEEFLSYENPIDLYNTKINSYEDCGYLGPIASNYDNNLQTWYEEGICEELNVTMHFESIAAGFADEIEIDPEVTYVVWMVPYTNQLMAEEAHFVFTEPYVSAKTSNAVYNDIDIEFTVYGADEFYVGIANKTEIEMMQTDLEMYLTYGPYGMGGPWNDFLNGGNASSMGTKVDLGKTSTKLSEIAGTTEIKAGSEYYIYVLPYTIGKPHNEYVFAESITPYVNICKTADLTLNETLKATVTDLTTAQYKYSFTITPPADGETYYTVLEKEEYEELTEEDILNEFSYSYSIEEAYEEEMSATPGTTYCIVTYSTKAGEKGPLTVQEFTTPTTVTSENIVVTFQSLVDNSLTDETDNTYTITFKVEGATKFAGHNITYPGSSWSPSLPSFEKNIWNQTTNTYVDVPESGIVEVKFAKNTYKKHYLANAFNVADNSVSEVGANTVIVEIATASVVQPEE